MMKQAATATSAASPSVNSRPAGQECDDERAGRSNDYDVRLVRDPIETDRANGGDDPDREKRQREFGHVVVPRGFSPLSGER